MTWTISADRSRLLADVSLWSADLANLEHSIAKVSPYADSFHIDVSDAHFSPGLLFFPDLVRAVRRSTTLPFHVHLMVERPTVLAPEFIAAGADLVTVHIETGPEETAGAIAQIQSAGAQAGLALRLDTPVASITPYLHQVETVLLLGTDVGVKGCPLDERAYTRMREAAALLRAAEKRHVRLIADGGIREHTVPALRDAGADIVVPGSLVFQSDDMARTFRWLKQPRDPAKA